MRLRVNQTHRNSHHPSDNLCLTRKFVALWNARRQRMRLQHQPVSLHCAPAASIPASNVNQVNWPLRFIFPSAGINSLPLWIYQHQRSRAQQRLHPTILSPDISIKIGVSVSKCGSLEMPPLLHHPRQMSRSLRIETRIKVNRQAHASRRGH